MTVLPLHRSAHREVVEARQEGRYDGVLMAIRALIEKADAERAEGRLGGAFNIAADYLTASLQATVERAG